MKKLITSSGEVINFKNAVIYAGCSVINKQQAKENLFIVKEILDKKGVFFTLTAGTLLGAVREHDFINHDEDIDLALFERDLQAFIDCIPLFMERGFSVCRYDRRMLISLMRGNEYIDFAFFRNLGNGIYDCDGCMMLSQFMENTSTISFLGSEFMAPTNFNGFLTCEYGPDWMTPRPYFNFHQSKWTIFKFKIKEFIKDRLPDSVYFKLAEKTANKQRQKYLQLFKRYTGEDYDMPL